MTYCLGILLSSGLVMASDSRSNAGVDQIARVRKMAMISVPGERVISILSAGNLATTQSVVTRLHEAAGSGNFDQDLNAARTMFDVANIIGSTLRDVMARDSSFVQPYGDPTGSFLVGGQLQGEPPRLFQIYSAGNFIEASDRACYLQIGETKYGKPILDRAVVPGTTVDEAAKLALLSFDATIRSNLSVGPPIDLLRYEANSFDAGNIVTFEAGNAYWEDIQRRYAEGLLDLVTSLPPPPR